MNYATTTSHSIQFYLHIIILL